MERMWVDFELSSNKPYSTLGCSPNLLVELCDWLRSIKKDIARIDIALYLFNNEELFRVLHDLAEGGCAVTVYSIPLEGYDNKKPAPIWDHTAQTFCGKKTKYDLAANLYQKIIDDCHPNFELRIIPHMYLRSKRVKPFSRGNMPYSLHCKTLLLEKSDGSTYAGLSSSNFAVRDAHKFEMAYVAKLDENELAVSRDFYAGLYDNSIDVHHFDNSADYSHFRIKMRPSPGKSHLMYTAPFYRGSAHEFEKNITTIINGAQKRILVCAQHISAYNYSFEHAYLKPGAPPGNTKERGFLSAVLQKSKAGVTTAFLSQTYVDTDGSHGCRSPENKKNFLEFISAAKASNCRYYVNDNVHCKFIVVDDTVLITTCNFTPTQFLYLENVVIPHFEKIKNFSYSGIHCEFGVYVAVKNKDLADHLIINFGTMMNDTGTKQMF